MTGLSLETYKLRYNHRSSGGDAAVVARSLQLVDSNCPKHLSKRLAIKLLLSAVYGAHSVTVQISSILSID